MKRQATKKTLQCIRLFSAALVVVGTIFSLVGLAQTDWTLVTPPKPDNVSAIAVASNNSNRVFLATEHWGGWDIKQGVTGRDPNNFYWTNVTPPYGLYEVHLAKLLPAPNTPTTIYMTGTQGGSIALSTDDGGTWSCPPPPSTGSCGGVGATPPEKPLPALAIHPTNAQTLLAGGKTTTGGSTTNYGGIKRSTNSGCQWTVMNFPPAATTIPITVVTDIKYVDSPTTTPPTNMVWAATANRPIYPVETPGTVPDPAPQGCAGVFRSANSGADWTQITIDAMSTNSKCVYSLAPVYLAGNNGPCGTPGKCLYAATRGGLYFTSNADADRPAWARQTIMSGNNDISSNVISSVSYTCSPTPTVYIGTYIGNTSLDGIYMTITIPGTLCRAPGFPASQNRVNTIGSRDGDSTTLYVAYDTGDISKGTCCDNNGNFTVTPVQGAHGGYPMDTIAVPPTTDGNTVYVATVCEGGIYKSTTGGGNWLQMHKPNHIQDNHDHFHYVMRMVAHPNPNTTINPGYIYVTDDDDMWLTSTGGGASGSAWSLSLDTTVWKPGGIHAHGIGITPSASSIPTNSVLYVGTGSGNWPDIPVTYLQVWSSPNGGGNPPQVDPVWNDVTCMKPPCDPKANPPDLTLFPQWNAANCDYTAASITNCTSLYSMAVSPTDVNGNLDPYGTVVFVGTWGSENYPNGVPPPVSFGYPPNQIMGQGHGVVRRWSTDGGNTWSWQEINKGLCTDAGDCTGTPMPPAKSLWVGSVAIDNLTSPNVYIATLNGLYKRKVSDDTTVAWTNITRGIVNPRFESIAIDPSDPTQQTVYAGTSELPGTLTPRIFRSTDGGGSWGAAPMTLPQMQPLAWATQYRVRDIKVTSATQAGQPKAYAVIEGSGIYRFNR